MTRKQRTTPVQTTSYLEAGPAEGPVIVLLHGWPELAVTWHHQIDHFASAGCRVIAPDMRGYGASTVPAEPSAYRQELIVADMIGLLDHVGAKEAIWVGHDWGTPTVWNIAAHFPERCTAAISLAIPFGTQGSDGRSSRIDRDRYPEESDPFGQFDYMVFYEQNPHRATAVFDANPANTVKYFFRRGDPAVLTRRAPSANITHDGGWFGGADQAPDMPLDREVLDDGTYAALTSALQTNGFHGPTGYYLNREDNTRYAESALHEGRLDMPVLFIGAEYDEFADIHVPSAHTRMRATCTDLTESVVSAGHWLQLEKPDEVNQIIENWLRSTSLAPLPRQRSPLASRAASRH